MTRQVMSLDDELCSSTTRRRSSLDARTPHDGTNLHENIRRRNYYKCYVNTQFGGEGGRGAVRQSAALPSRQSALYPRQ